MVGHGGKLFLESSFRWWLPGRGRWLCRQSPRAMVWVPKWQAKAKVPGAPLNLALSTEVARCKVAAGLSQKQWNGDQNTRVPEVLLFGSILNYQSRRLSRAISLPTDEPNYACLSHDSDGGMFVQLKAVFEHSVPWGSRVDLPNFELWLQAA